MFIIFDSECSKCSALAQLARTKQSEIKLISIHSRRAQRILNHYFPAGWKFRPYLSLDAEPSERLIYGIPLYLRMIGWLGVDGIAKAAQAWLRNRKQSKQIDATGTTARDRVRVHAPATLLDAADDIDEPLMLPDAGGPSAPVPTQIIQWYNGAGTFLTSTTWTRQGHRFNIEQCHRALPLPAAAPGHPTQTVTLASGRQAILHRSKEPASDAGASSGTKDTAATLIIPRERGRWLAIRASNIDHQALITLADTLAPFPAPDTAVPTSRPS